MPVRLFRNLLLLILFSTTTIFSQTLYWVGGSGNWNDPAHWSLTSGGSPINKIPDQNANVIFDDNSVHGQNAVVTIVGSNDARSLKCENSSKEIFIDGNSSSSLKINGSFVLNQKTTFTVAGKLRLSGKANELSVFNQGLNKLDADVLFEQGNWDLGTVQLEKNRTVTFLNGTYTVGKNSIVADNVIANSGPVTFNYKGGALYARNLIELGKNVKFNSDGLIIAAQKYNSSLFKVDKSVSFGSNYKLLLPAPMACTISYTFTNPSCNNICDASISVNFSGCLNPPYTLNFNTSASCIPPGANNVFPPTYSLTNLCACGGNLLDILVFDTAYVTGLFNLNMPQNPTPINFTPITFTQPSCNGLCNGALTFNVNGSNQPYSINLVSPGPTTHTLSGLAPLTNTTIGSLCAGVQTVVITDSKGCTRTFTPTLNQPPILAANGTSASLACNNVCTGSVQVSPTGGTPGFTVNWSTGSSVTIGVGGSASLTGLCIGAITGTVTDTKGCKSIYNTTITQPPALAATTGFTNATCGGTCNATASVNITGGTPGYTYSWTPSGQTSSLAINLCGTVAPTPPNHTVTVTDLNGCVLTKTFTITEPLPIALAPTSNSILCNLQCTGTATANASGGNGSYTYTWMPGSITTATAGTLCAGIYTVTVKDASLCTTTSTVQIQQPPAISLTVGTSSVTCNGLCTGGATATATGGTPGFTYTWTPTPGVGTPTAGGLCFGNYTLNIKDANNCPATTTFSIAQPPPILPNVTSASITCAGLCNGSINSAPSGGTAPYNYTLASTTSTLTSNPPYNGLCVGIYTLIVKDAQGCSKSQTVNIAQPNTFTLSVTTTSLSCFGQCNASLSGNILGGTPGYTYTWITPSTTITGNPIVNQCAGNYSLTVTDANGCNTGSAVTIASVSPISISLTPTSANCSGSNNGSSITSTITGGTPGYTLSWSPGGATTPSVSNIGPGTYTLLVTDSKGCTKTETATIIPTPTISITTTAVPVTCAGMCNGQAFANATGGTGAFTYSWTPTAQTGSATANNLCPGNYVVTATDSKGCTKTANVTISAPTVLSAAITGMQPSCNVCIGSATVVASGGTPTYSYSWSPSAQNTPTAGGLCVGVQTVVVTDLNGCTATTTVNVTQSVILNITTNGSTLSCNGGCTGIASANATGGQGPYTYTWTAPTLSVISSSSVATNLCAGTYTVGVNDALGCFATATISFANPPAMTVTATQTNAACNSTCNGVISLNASGGTGSLTYSWSPSTIGGNVSTVTNLCAGNYTGTVTDANGCSVSKTYTITEPTALTASFTAIPPSICSGTNGAITATVSGGTPTYTYNWTPLGANSASICCLTAGSYSLLVTDGNGCTATLVASVSDPTGPTLSLTSNSVSCSSSCNGSATVTATGTGPMTYTWSAPIVSSTPTATNICQGTWAVSVTDQSVLCTTTQTFSIAQPPTFSLNPTTANPTCGGVACNGSISTAAGGGTGPYNYTLTSATATITTPPAYTSLCAGTYTLNVSDANFCNYSQTFTLTSPPALSLTVNATDIKCFSQCNGSATAGGSGGTAPLSYTWLPVGSFPGSPLATIVNLCANVYTVIVTDASGCSITQTVQIIEPPLLTSTLVSQNAVCNSQCNGSATLTASGGVTTYSYSWSGSGVTTSTINGLCAGGYIGTVTDANGCTSVQNYTITQPPAINIVLTPTNPLCESQCNGAITGSVTGGTGAYTYSWMPSSQTTSVATNLCANNYTLIVYDANNCTVQNQTSLTDPPPLMANVFFSNASCGAVCNGSATSNPMNGSGTYTYSWSNGATGPGPITGLCAGVYSVAIVDGNSCTASQQFTISTPPSLTVNPASSPATCGVTTPCNGSITVVTIGGTPIYNYTWIPPVSTTSVATNLCAMVYTVTVTDGVGCSSTFQLPLSNSNGPSGATVTSTDVACNAQCNGVASVTNPVGGTPSYTVSWITTPTWTPAPTSTTVPQTGLCADTYTAQIIDSLGCLFFTPVTINEPAPLVDNSNASLPLCNGICNGSISVAPTGGTPSYTFAWSTGATSTGTTSSLTGLCTGNYSLTVTDVNLCTYTVAYNMPGSTSITANTVSINNNCFNNCNGILNLVNLNGGTPGYTFNWSDPLGQSTQQATGLCSGNYFVVVTDQMGCFDTIRGTITSPSAITLTSSISQPSCGLCNGTATVGALGGTAPFTYSWSSGATGVTSNSLCAGLYMVTITDNLGCTQNINVPINNANGITGETVNVTNETCFGQCNGAATVTAVGGTAPISYSWTAPAVNTNTLNNLCGGTYFVQMMDGVGCIRTSSVTISAATDLTLTPFITQPTCTATNGSIIITSVTGGTGPYNYAWTPAAPNTPSLTNIGAGTYSVVVTDAASGCSKAGEFFVANQNAPTISISNNNLLCNGACNGTVSFTITTGAAPYSYAWSNGASGTGTTSTINGLCSGAVNLTVTANGCTLTQSVTITEPNAIVMSLPIVNTPDCNGDCNGSITLVPSGGTLPYTYTWTPSANTNPLTGLCPGNYSATVVDANGCTSINSFTMINPPPLGLTASVTPATCNTSTNAAVSTTVSGGLPAYTYTWTGPAAFTSTSSAISNISPGTYSLTLIDFSGCRRDTVLNIASNATVLAVAGNDTTFCINGQLLLDGSNSLGATNYQWIQLPSPPPIATTPTILTTPPVGSSTFVLVVSDAVSGCSDSDTINVNSNVPPVVDAGPNYTMTIYTSTVIGGSPTSATGVSYTWTPSFALNDPSISNPTASNTVNLVYTVTVSDANGCIASDTMRVDIFPDIFIPNGFSPNGDNKNDKWIIDNIEQFTECTVEIFNRWGESLFYSKGYTTKWDGKYKGKDLPVGTYYYVINLHHEFFPNPYTGPLTIFR